MRSPDVIESARQIVEEEPTISSRRLSQRMSVSQTTAIKFLKEYLQCFPYKIQIAQQLTDVAIEKRMDFAGEICQMIDEHTIDINMIIFTDEAHFWLDGYVNRQNFRVWGTEKPKFMRIKPLHPKKLTVWCGLSNNEIIGPIIESSITSEVYHEMLIAEMLSELKSRRWLDGFHFQHDGAAPHTTRLNLELLKEYFGTRIIARGFQEMFVCGLAWLPYSPDILPLDFFLWGYIKNRIYQNNPKTLAELKNGIINMIKAILVAMPARSIGSFERHIHILTHTGRI